MFKFLSKKKTGETVEAGKTDETIETGETAEALASADLPIGEQIGSVAGRIWHLLSEQGETGIAELVKQVDAPRDLVMQGIGWLARENKVRFGSSTNAVSLVDDEQAKAA